MNIDEQIQQALHNEAQQLDEILAHEPGLFNRLGNVYKSSTRVWVGIASIGALSHQQRFSTLATYFMWLLLLMTEFFGQYGF